MKRVLSYLLLGLAVLCAMACVWWGVACARDYAAISADPSASGIDYLGLGFLYALGFWFCGIPGLFVSALARRKAEAGMISMVSRILAVLFALVILGGFCLWAFGPGHF